MTMDDQTVTELLFLAADGELDPERAEAVRSRIEACEDCAREALYVQRLLQVIRCRCVRIGAPTRLRLRILSTFEHRRGAT